MTGSQALLAEVFFVTPNTSRAHRQQRDCFELILPFRIVRTDIEGKLVNQVFDIPDSSFGGPQTRLSTSGLHSPIAS